MTDDRIQTLLDIEEIRNLRTRYGHHLDSGNVDGLKDVFAPDAIVDAGRGVWRGLEEVRTGLADAVKEYDRDKKGSYPFLHAVTNHWVKITGPNTAQGRCYLIDFETASKLDPNPLLLLGLYADEYRRIDDRWVISRTRLETVWPQRNGGGGEPGNGMTLPS
jgi:hypothetical protein